MNFWTELEKPILALAPLANVTDAAFRYIISKYSKRGNYYPFITYTEFVSADGLALAPEEGRRKLLKDLEYSEIEKPIVAQFFTSRPENMEKAAHLAVELGFDGVDINMGCPDKSVEKQGAGAVLIKTPELARDLIRGAQNGTRGRIPVSVKTRLGYNRDELETWLPELLAENPAAIIVHARTRKEMSKVPARWERVKRAVEIRDGMCQGQKEKTLILGNGDIIDTADAREKCRETGADGAMLGRAIFGRPYLFSNSRELENKEKIQILLEHIQLFDQKLGQIKSFAIMKKHFKAYLSGTTLTQSDASTRELREKLFEAENCREAVEIINNFLI